MRIWVARYRECIGGKCDSAAVLIRAETREDALEKAKLWSQSIMIKFLSLDEFVDEAMLIDAHYV